MSKNSVSLAGIRRGLCASLMPLVVALYATAQVQFAPPITYAVGTYPVATVAGDFSGDGKFDLAVANNGSNDVSVLLGNGDGTFQAAVSYPAGPSPNFMAAGDFNGDGKIDLAVTNGTANTVSILLGNGDGTFQPPVQYSNGGNAAVYIAVGDFNKDGKLDLYISDGSPLPATSIGPIHVNVLLGNGDGTFQTPVQTIVQGVGSGGSPPHNNPFAALGDFNGDGYLDVALSEYFGSIASNFGGYLTILLGNGDGTFQPPAYYSFGPVDDDFASWGVVSGDFNGDGKIDLAASAFTGMWVWLGNGDGTFTFIPNPAGGYGSYGGLFRASAVADLSNNGKLDLVALGGSVFYSAIEWGLGNGDGTFAGLPVNDPTCVAASSCMPLPVALTDLICPPVLIDLNGDKLPDIVITQAGENSISVFLDSTNNPSIPLNLTVAGPSYAGTVVSQPAALACLASCVANFAPGTTVTLTESPALTYYFVGWSGACSGAGSTCTVTMNTAQSVTATFNSYDTLQATFSGAGAGTIASMPSGPLGFTCGTIECSGDFLPGTVVTLTATPDSTSTFAGWGAPCSGTGTCTLTMTGNEVVTATFAAAGDFSLTSASATLSLQPGAQGTDVMTLTGVNGGFGGTIQLACVVVGPAPAPTCSLSPTSVTPGMSSASSTLTITTPTGVARLGLGDTPFGKLTCALWLPLMFGIVMHGKSRQHGRGQWIYCGTLLLLLTILPACGGNSSKGPTSYTVTVTGTSGAIQHSAQVVLTVQ